MELLIILVVIVAVSVVVYFQLKGAKPEVLTVSDLTVPYKKKEKKEPKVEKKVAVEQWDKAEVVKRDSSPGEKRRNRQKNMFDPVKEGLKVVAAPKTIAEDAQAGLTEKEEKAQKKRLEADGFVVVKEKKPVAVKADEPAFEPVEEEKPIDLSPAAQRLAMLKAIVQGNASSAPRDSSAPSSGFTGGSSGPRRPAGESNPRREVSHQEIKERLEKQKQEAEEAKKRRSTADKGGKVSNFTAGTEPSKPARWAKTPILKEEPKEEAKPEEKEAEPEPAAAEEEKEDELKNDAGDDW